MKTIQAKAKVHITIEVDAGAPWGDDCQIGQLYKQATDSAREKLLYALRPEEHPNFRIIGEPKIIGVITETA